MGRGPAPLWLYLPLILEETDDGNYTPGRDELILGEAVARVRGLVDANTDDWGPITRPYEDVNDYLALI